MNVSDLMLVERHGSLACAVGLLVAVIGIGRLRKAGIVGVATILSAAGVLAAVGEFTYLASLWLAPGCLIEGMSEFSQDTLAVFRGTAGLTAAAMLVFAVGLSVGSALLARAVAGAASSNDRSLILAAVVQATVGGAFVALVAIVTVPGGALLGGRQWSQEVAMLIREAARAGLALRGGVCLLTALGFWVAHRRLRYASVHRRALRWWVP